MNHFPNVNTLVECIHSFTHSFNQYSLNIYSVPITVPGTVDTAISKTKALFFWNVQFSGRRQTINKNKVRWSEVLTRKIRPNKEAEINRVLF